MDGTGPGSHRLGDFCDRRTRRGRPDPRQPTRQVRAGRVPWDRRVRTGVQGDRHGARSAGRGEGAARRGGASREDVDRFLREARSAARLAPPGHRRRPRDRPGRGRHAVPGRGVRRGPTLAALVQAGPLEPTASGRDRRRASPTPWPTPTRTASSTATSSRPTSCSTRTAGPHLMDFGLAKREAGESPETVEGQVLGTPAYMSPGAGPRRGPPGRWPQRRLQPRRHPLRAADRRAAVPRQPADAAAPGAGRRAAAAATGSTTASPRPGDDLPEGDGQGRRPALRHGRRAGRRPAAIPPRRTGPGPAGRAVRTGLALVPGAIPSRPACCSPSRSARRSACGGCPSSPRNSSGRRPWRRRPSNRRCSTR